MTNARTLKSIAGWATAAAAGLGIIAGAVSVGYDCHGAANSAEPCVWARSLFLVTSGVFFVIAWPICLVAGLVFSWWEDLRP